MRKLTVTITNQDCVVLDSIEIEVEDYVKDIDLAPRQLTPGGGYRECLWAVDTLVIGLED